MGEYPKADLGRSFQEQQNRLIEDICSTGDVLSQYSYLVELSARLPHMPDGAKEDAKKVEKCQSQVWIRGKRDGDGVFFEADSDTLIVRGVLYLMLSLVNGRGFDEVSSCEFDFVNETELKEAFSDVRLNGFGAIENSIQSFC